MEILTGKLPIPLLHDFKDVQKSYKSPSVLEKNKMNGAFMYICSCGHCQPMPSTRECICCHEVHLVHQKIQESEKDIPCITLHDVLVALGVAWKTDKSCLTKLCCL